MDVLDLTTFDVEGAVQAEVFVVCLNGDRLELTGPCGPQSWYIEVSAGEHPVDVVARVVGAALGKPQLVHSTSWRRDREAVILTFIVVVDPSQVEKLTTMHIGRAELARSESITAPADISTLQVLEHGLRHLAWLVRDDPVVARELSAEWRTALDAYVPEPFRALGV